MVKLVLFWGIVLNGLFYDDKPLVLEKKNPFTVNDTSIVYNSILHLILRGNQTTQDVKEEDYIMEVVKIKITNRYITLLGNTSLFESFFQIIGKKTILEPALESKTPFSFVYITEIPHA